MPDSPSTLNYFIGKGKAFWTPAGGSLRDLGNAPSFEIVPEVEKLDHFSSRLGIRTKDRSIVLEKSGIVNMTLDEATPENLQLALFGSAVAVDTADDKSFNILGVDTLEGALKFIGTNDIGNQFTVDVFNVSITPSAGFNFVSEEFGTIELEAEMLVDGNGDFGTVTEHLPDS